VLAGFDDARLAGVADSDAEAAERLAAAHGARRYPGHRELLDAERLDAVWICVPPFAHGPIERDVLAAGLPMFVEKPVAADLAVAEEIAALVEQAGVPTATGYHWRYLDTIDEARALLAIDPPRLVQASWVDKVPPPPWWSRRDLSGGQTVEQTTHVLDLLRVLAGDVLEVTALAARFPCEARADADVDDVTAATLRFASGAVGSVVSSCLAAAKHRAGVELVCDGRVLELSESELAVSDRDGRRVRAADGQAKVRVDRDFVDAVRGRTTEVRAPYAEALRSHRLACALARSAREGGAVQVAA
jgi:myo-inositol 2-dehydrogenase / D-chiro-inositol 1-dehydrogenase